MQFSKEYDQWYLKPEEKDHHYWLNGFSSVPQGTVLVCKSGKSFFMFQSLGIKNVGALRARSLIGFMQGSLVSSLGEVLNYTPAMTIENCRLPTYGELSFYHQLKVI